MFFFFQNFQIQTPLTRKILLTQRNDLYMRVPLVEYYQNPLTRVHLILWNKTPNPRVSGCAKLSTSSSIEIPAELIILNLGIMGTLVWSNSLDVRSFNLHVSPNIFRQRIASTDFDGELAYAGICYSDLFYSQRSTHSSWVSGKWIYDISWTRYVYEFVIILLKYFCLVDSHVYFTFIIILAHCIMCTYMIRNFMALEEKNIATELNSDLTNNHLAFIVTDLSWQSRIQLI